MIICQEYGKGTWKIFCHLGCPTQGQVSTTKNSIEKDLQFTAEDMRADGGYVLLGHHMQLLNTLPHRDKTVCSTLKPLEKEIKHLQELYPNANISDGHSTGYKAGTKTQP